jgi:hypothetical protein
VQEDARALAATRRELLRQSARERVEAIRASNRPRRLVRALSPQDLFLTLREAGMELGGALLAHASRHQLDFLADLEAWTSGEFDASSLAAWIERLESASEQAVAHWITEADETTVVLGLSRLIRVYKADPSVDEDTLPAGRQLASLDGIYYLEPTEACTEDAFLALWRGLQRVRAVSAAPYEALLEQVIWAIPAEQEEAAYEARASRLAERGFPPLEEALEVWSPDVEALESARREAARHLPAPEDPPRLPSAAATPAQGRTAAALPIRVGIDAFHRVSLALGELDDDRRESWLHELVRLGNRFAVASLEPLAVLETHRRGLRQALSHVQLGLELAAGTDAPAERLALLAARMSVLDLARAGTAAVNRRAERARRLAAGWIAEVPFARARLDEAHRAALDGLTAARPTYGMDDPPRPFRRAAELEEADEVLDTLDGLGAFLTETLEAPGGGAMPELAGPLAAHPDPEQLPWHAVALTTLARAASGGPARPEPFPREALADALAALRGLFEDASRLAHVAAELRLGPALAWLMSVHAEELAPLKPDDPPDPRFVPALLVRG